MLCMLLPGRNNHCKKITVVTMNWLTVTKYSLLKWQWIFSFLHRFFLSSVTDGTFVILDYMSNMTAGCFIKSPELFTLDEHLGSPPVFWLGPCCLSLKFVCCVVFLVCVLFLVCPMLMMSLDCPFLNAPAVFSNVY